MAATIRTQSLFRQVVIYGSGFDGWNEDDDCSDCECMCASEHLGRDCVVDYNCSITAADWLNTDSVICQSQCSSACSISLAALTF